MTTPDRPPLFRDLAFVVLPVSDVPRARAFYEGVLGLVVTTRWDDQWVEYDIGGGTLAITVADERHQPGRHGAMPGLEVIDLDETIRQMRAAGVPLVDGPFDSPACRGCVVTDPDGNELILHAKK